MEAEDGCHRCVGDCLGTFKQIARVGVSDATCNATIHAELFQWQCIGQLMGRYDDTRLADLSDMTGRQHYDKLRVKNFLAPLVARFEVLYDEAIIEEGKRFGCLAAEAHGAHGDKTIPCNLDALIRVPTGAMTINDVPALGRRRMECGCGRT